jgi:tryptophanyl-tRNA synthetase
VPDAFIPKVGAKIQSLVEPTKKMSKSDENAAGSIFLLDDADTVRRKFKRAVTDSGAEIRFDEQRPAITNLLTIYQLLTGKQPAEVEANFEGKGYAQLKSELAETTVEFLRPLQERARGYSDEELERTLDEGRARAQALARPTLDDVKARLGLVGARRA